jgi:acyl carrier protein
MIARNEISNSVLDYISTVIEVPFSELAENDILDDQLGIDYLTLSEILEDLEDEFNLVFTDIDTSEMVSVGDIIDCIFKKVN